jgi:hypothetical protein
MDLDEVEAINNLWYFKYHNNKTCQLCQTNNTPLWRKTTGYIMLCNRCGLQNTKKQKFKKCIKYK